MKDCAKCRGRCLCAVLAAFVLMLVGFGPTAKAFPAPRTSVLRQAVEPRVNYAIDATLDGETKRLAGRETITWINGTRDSVGDLAFHLYLNAYANNRSIHLDEARGQLRGHKVKSGWSSSRIEAIRLADGTDLLPTLRYLRPDGGSPEDRTVFHVDLPAPVPPGATLEVEVEWDAQLPRVRRRTGFKDDFLLVAQWFPKLGVYEEGRGWNCHSFHMNSEFYSDYGHYDVTLDLPADYEGRVFGSGQVESSTRSADRIEVVIRAPSREDRARVDRTGKRALVHDFTWTGDPRYVVRSFGFKYDEWAKRYPEEVRRAREAFGGDKDLTLRDVEVIVLIHPERGDQAERHYHATAAALFFYGLWFGEYPYESITVIDPPWGGRAAGGMEYPTLFTCGTRLFSEPDMYTPESVTVHEAGHQFWFGLVGNNEFEAAFLDEGFNSYTDSEVLVRVYGPRRSTTSYGSLPFDGVPRYPAPGGSGSKLADVLANALCARSLPLPFVPDPTPMPSSSWVDLWRDQPLLTFSPERGDPRWSDRSSFLRNGDWDPLETFSFEHANRASYRANSYPRTAVTLRTLNGMVGNGPFLRGMRHYAEEWRYRHPYPGDFYAAFQEGSGLEEDLSWFFEEFFAGAGTGDWSLGVEQRREPKPKGLFPDDRGVYREVADEDDGDDESEQDSGDGDEKSKRPWLVDILLRRQGSLRVPVTVRLTFDDDSVEEFEWTREAQGEKRWLRHTIAREAKLVSAELDPDGWLYVDSDRSNNAWFDERDELVPLRWAERVLARTTQIFNFYAGIGG